MRNVAGEEHLRESPLEQHDAPEEFPTGLAIGSTVQFKHRPVTKAGQRIGGRRYRSWSPEPTAHRRLVRSARDVTRRQRISTLQCTLDANAKPSSRVIGWSNNIAIRVPTVDAQKIAATRERDSSV